MGSAIVASGHSLVPTVATVFVDTSNGLNTIPADFVGISIETADVISGGYYQGTTSGAAASMISLLKMLGSNGVFRVGGNSADTIPVPALTQTIANNFQSFLGAIGSGWTNNVIWNLDLAAADTTTAATHAGYVANAFGSSHVSFQFGNEAISQGLFTQAAYQTAWNNYYSAVTTAVSGANYAAWDDTGIQLASSIIPNLTAGIGGLSSVTYHYYSAAADITHHTTMTAAALLGNIRSQRAFYGVSGPSFVPPSKQRMTETNTLGNSGALGLSDRMVSATWYLNQAIILANQGYAGINTHNHYAEIGVPGLPTVGNGFYNPLVLQVDGNFAPGPIFYGLYLFSKIEGQQIISSSVGGNANVAAIATKGANGNANILAVNNDVSNAVTVTPAQSAAWTTAKVLMVQDSDGGGCGGATLTVGGQPIGESGSWTGAPYTINNGQSVQIPPCGAALIQVQP